MREPQNYIKKYMKIGFRVSKNQGTVAEQDGRDRANPERTTSCCLSRSARRNFGRDESPLAALVTS